MGEIREEGRILTAAEACMCWQGPGIWSRTFGKCWKSFQWGVARSVFHVGRACLGSVLEGSKLGGQKHSGRQKVPAFR